MSQYMNSQNIDMNNFNITVYKSHQYIYEMSTDTYELLKTNLMFTQIYSKWYKISKI